MKPTDLNPANLNPAGLLAGLRQCGLSVAFSEGDVLLRGPRSLLTPELYATVKSQKDALLKLLAAESAPEPVENRGQGLQISVAHHSIIAGRDRLALEVSRIAGLFPTAVRLKSGAWRIDGTRYDHEQALQLAAYTTGFTSDGYPVSFDAGAAYRASRHTEEYFVFEESQP